MGLTVPLTADEIQTKRFDPTNQIHRSIGKDNNAFTGRVVMPARAGLTPYITDMIIGIIGNNDGEVTLMANDTQYAMKNMPFPADGGMCVVQLYIPIIGTPGNAITINCTAGLSWVIHGLYL